ncbi:MAG: sugar phosphate isomerase/epimerase [OM182 bacterium]|nr:MAG: sugar phosphate isomerase/epimerase [OM182 bacterium]HBK17710.1 sugar phosphate isomerase/epimerase [Gammaproteobacteria bacterium]|tara:strand:- start:6507 stop:7274 length:768 start_codon:yes stop_codon:yes gene_type:complete
MAAIVPISVQLYSVREASAENFDQVLDVISRIGFKGVEPFNLFGKRPADFRRQVEDLGMQVSSTHFPWVNRSPDIGKVADTVKTLGLDMAPGGFWPDDFKDMEAIKRTIDTTQGLVDDLARYDLKLFLHNHYWEFAEVEGRPGYHYLQDAVPDVLFQIDTYWAANFGKNDAAAELSRVRERTPLLHIKDGPLVPDEPHVAVGSGKMNFEEIFAAVDPSVFQWAVVELDHCATDMLTALAMSYQYLTTQGFAEGNV